MGWGRTSPPWPFAALLAMAVVAAVGFWPFDFQTRCNICPNGAEVLPGRPGIAFVEEGLVIDEGAGPEISRRLSAAEGLTIALVARSDRLFQQGPARIVSLSDGASERNFTIGQQRDRLVFRLRTPATGPNGSRPATAAPFVVWPGVRRLFAVTYDGAAFRLYADGALAGERHLVAGELAGWGPDFRLLFGNETTGDRPWRGHLFDVAIYDRALAPEEVAVLTPAALARPAPERVYHLGSRCPAEMARPSPRGVRAGHCLIPAEYNNAHVWNTLGPGPRQVADYLFNAALWLPLGAFAVLAGGQMWLWLALPALTVVVELGQASLFSRTSSAHDLAAALAGLAAGALLTRRFRPH